jgi:hypothetical protein
MTTTEFFIEVIDGNPIQLTQKAGPPPADYTANLSYWSLSADATGDYLPVLMHIYYHGDLPRGEDRGRINVAIVDYVQRLLADGS